MIVDQVPREQRRSPRHAEAVQISGLRRKLLSGGSTAATTERESSHTSGQSLSQPSIQQKGLNYICNCDYDNVVLANFNEGDNDINIIVIEIRRNK